MSAGARRHERLANLRLAVAGIAVALVWLVSSGRASAQWFGLPLLLFLVLVVLHDRVLKRTERSRRARRIYERGLARLDGTWASSGADGARFVERADFAADLDLFGAGSLFQLINTARTEVGEEVIAEWLTNGAPIDEVIARQAAVDELRPMIEFREALAVTAADVHVGKTSALGRWAGGPAPPVPGAAVVAFAGLSVVSVLLVAAALSGRMPPGLLILWLGIQVGITLLWGRRQFRALADMDDALRDLALLKVLLERLETQAFSSPRLTRLRDSLPADGLRASQTIAGLERLVTALDSCRNQIVAPIAVFFQVPSLIMIAIARWRVAHGRHMAAWLRAVGEIEAFSAISTFAFEHPESPFPEVVPGAPVFDADGLAHPLIHGEVAVANDVRLGGEAPHVLMVSGSNMSGKSTLLRAVGVNVVLALAGAPVRAARLRLSPLALGVTLRIEDSLQGGHSKFYAEILRLRSIVDLSRGPVPLLFLLDEILAGTNSYDRRIGAEAVIRALAGAGAIGLVTTHDLALTELVSTLGAPAANVHFEDRIEDGRMVFDYRMRPGVVQRSNALELMRTIGLNV
ncbi:MAG: DNA mismatch repair protein MutS [Acidobacteria bacterium]|nr:MAG: DNA mismatch repair protein MutS [Acidobacteriota bacterium]